MTKEQQSLQELGLSEAQLAERQDRVKQLISIGTTQPASMADLDETAPIKPAKKPRSDKGTKRVKPEPASAPASRKLSKEDMNRWRDLMATVSGRRTEMDQAIARFKAAEEGLDAWIADHTA